MSWNNSNLNDLLVQNAFLERERQGAETPNVEHIYILAFAKVERTDERADWVLDLMI